MAEWYHSGIEAYCKSAAALAEMKGSGGWSAFGSDLLPSRFDRADKATKTWTLSRFRRGSGNRLSVFEDEWLQKINTSTEYDVRENLAVKSCVNNLIASTAQHDEAESPLAALLFREGNYRFATEFAESVVPAIASGFQTEGYHSSDITRFKQDIIELVGDLRAGDKEAFRAFGTSLTAALIYGPGHRLTMRNRPERTVWRNENESVLEWIPEDNGNIVISQLFASGFSYIGYSEQFTQDNVIFFGRSGNLGDYIRACEEYLPQTDKSLIQDITAKSKIVFPIARGHSLVSNAHGLLVHQGQNWYFLDYSSNGTSITSRGEERFVHLNGTAIEPGDRIRLGTDCSDPQTCYQHAATVLVSFCVNDQAS